MIKNMFYFQRLNSIGGIETFFWHLVRKYQDLDIVIVYKQADPEQLKRLRQYCRCIQFNGERIRCKKAFFAFNSDIIDYVDADEYIGILHGDYKVIGVIPKRHPKIEKYISISEVVRESYRELTGDDSEVCYNPYIVEKPRKVLNLISATRLTKEKGRPRIKKLASALEEADIPYIWTVFTDDVNYIDNDNIIYRRPRLDILDFIGNSDYLVQLSNTEGYCYSVVEALSMGTPVIVTDCPVFREIGVEHGVNGFIIDFDMLNIPVQEIYKGLKKFSYKPKEDDWSKYLAKGENQYKKDMVTIVSVKCTKDYFDLQLKRQMRKGDIFETNKVRAEIIESAHYGEILKGGS